MTNERNTHFQNAAKLLLDRLMNKFDHLPPGQWGPAESDELIIAQFAYDIVLHTVTECHKWDMGYMDIPELMDKIPDLTNTSPEAP